MAKKSVEAKGAAAAPDVLPRLEQAILGVFRDYLMTPGKMLCLSSLDRKVYGPSLAKMVDKQLLTAESFKDGYSLTASGYAAMCNCR